MDSALPIFSRVNESGTIFISLERALSNSSRFAAQVRSEDIKDEFDRFKIWAGNIAAHRKGRRSLEYRLRDAAILKDEAHNLLTALHHSLQTSLEIVQEKRRPWDELSDSESDSDAEFRDDTELKQLLGSIKTTITCLFRLSMSIRDPAPNDQSRSIITVDKSYFEEYDMQHAKAKYPGCAAYLVERLGRANSGRRQYLSYREEHHQKLAKDVDLIGLEAPRTEYTSNSTEATKAQLNSFDVLDGDDALSQTSYATSVNAAIRVPPLPRDAREQEHYECPICFMIVSIHTAAGWKQHVYRDLHPYCCTFEDCTTADRLYDSRHAWFAHELEAHRTSWQCIEGCNKTFSSEKDFDRHAQAFHPDLCQPGMLSALKRTAAKRASLSDEAHCPLCHQRMALRLLQRHVARHQEQLALFALPPNLEATEDDPQDEEREDVGGWQDEELSDVSDVSESAGGELAGSSPEALGNPVQELDTIALEFHNLAPECEKFISRPPREQAESDYLREKLSRMIMRVLLRVDGVEIFGDSYARLRRKELVTEIQLLLKRMDGVLPTEPNEDDIGKHEADLRDRARAEWERQEREQKRQREEAIAEYENKKLLDAKKAKEEEEAWRLKIKLDDEARREKEKREYEEFLLKQKQKGEEECKKREEEEKLEEGMTKRLAEFGFQNNQIRAMIKPEEDLLPGQSPGNPLPLVGQQPTYIKVHRDHISTETLNYFDVPWKYDADDRDYYVILREMDQRDTDLLFEHTRSLRTHPRGPFHAGL